MSIINKRYSRRIFNSKNVEDEKIIKIVEAGMLAPSSKNKKPWQFIILSDLNLLKEFSDFHSNWSILKNVNKAIIVCGDFGADERQAQMLMACSAASQNILLKATELELGSVWLGCFPDEARIGFIKTRLELPTNIMPISVIALGYSDDKKERDRPIDNTKIHFNKW